ncbi:uncharacterized protein LOC134222183 [Armigeres subalbatus]|uniref:uncharacterized protein LOC134222183 n=1 Tax=Armigeres subalbatus TaxID=124917 RepID=UPI002ED4E0B9
MIGVNGKGPWRFLKANGVVEDVEKYDLLLVLGGIELQAYYDKVFKWEVQTPAGDGSDELVPIKYDSAILSLDKYFAPQTKKRFERHLLRAMKQEEQEPFEEYVFRLQDQANRCAFADVDDMIVDQIIEGCKSSDLRKRLLTEDVTLSDSIILGKTIEEVQKQTREYERHPSTIRETPMIVQRISEQKTRFPGNNDLKSSKKCYSCNRYGHISREIEKCAARDSTCFNCGTKGHFKVCCRRRKLNEFGLQKGQKSRRVHAITENQDDHKAVFFVAGQDLNEVLRMDIGGVIVSLLIDSGSPANIINSETFEFLKGKHAEILNERSPDPDDRKLKSFASDESILFSNAFEAQVKIPGESSGIWAHILVAPRGQTNLLSKSTAFALGVLKIGYNVNHIIPENPIECLAEFPKVPNVSLNIHLDKNVQPVVQAARRFPIAMEADVENAIQELLQKNIIERAEGPLTWVSPLVPIRKTDGRIRLCVDMRAANKAVKEKIFQCQI